MIAHLKGQLIYKSPEHTIVDVNGIGYKVFTPLSTYYSLPKSGEPVVLRIHTRVREDELKLFGFLTEEDVVNRFRRRAAGPVGIRRRHLR